MSFSIYSLGFIAVLAGLVQARPTPTTPSIEDLTSPDTTAIPGLPEIPSSTGSEGSSFMGVALSNDLDLGSLEEFPTDSTDLVIGSIQNISNNGGSNDGGNNDEDTDEEDSDEEDSDEEDSDEEDSDEEDSDEEDSDEEDSDGEDGDNEKVTN